ncbi:Pseudouridine synthase, Rsu [marine gamma proteobacterium HTCC2080]|nr:Pseudouridine synthase, Rsu [marine gamma proteobacterium HTCC2080]
MHQLLAQGRILLDGLAAESISQVVGPFTHVVLDQRVLQAEQPRYIMLNKPPGMVSATCDEQHSTVLDLVSAPNAKSLHIVGRLDFNSTGLLLLTNDGRWSRGVSSPQKGVVKTYRVQLEQPFRSDYREAFAAGLYFAFENITTRPAEIRRLSDLSRGRSVEGRYHQIKRMFGYFNNRVLNLHRLSIGALSLDPKLHQGAWRELTLSELNALGVEHCYREVLPSGSDCPA